MLVGELRPHVHAQLRVEVRQRLVHQERGRLAHDRATHRHALALPARQCRRPAVEQILETQHVGHLFDPRGDLSLRRAAHLEAVPQVLAHGHVRVQRVALEDHRDVAVARREVGHVAAADRDRARGHLLEAGEHPQERALAAPRRPDEHHELAVLDAEGDVVDGDHASGVFLGQRFDRDLCHALSLVQTAAGTSPATMTVRISSRSSSTTTSAGPPTLEHSDAGETAGPRGNGRRSGDRILERRAQRVQVPNRLQHREHAARELAGRPARDAVAHVDGDAGQGVVPIADAGGGDRVRDQREPPGGCPPDEQLRVTGEMVAVDDRLHDHVATRQRCARDSRLTMVEAPHRIEEVRHRADAAVERDLGLRRGRSRMPEPRRRCRARAGRRSTRARREARAQA